MAQSGHDNGVSTMSAFGGEADIDQRSGVRQRLATHKGAKQSSLVQCHLRERPLPPDLPPRPSLTLSLIPEYQSKTVPPGPNCSRETIANLAARMRSSC